ncbi:M48 family metallopeptidase [Vibrio sp. SM6]|uniref:M48 family metallopeptidase n=1 Tax=Vibrio agarilyticus TaxID=2726741 RepID=A0A7X8YH81_9VIBR|nr:M48 family metallopeptidase [Vibrio agarilyticus]NLS13315.1 M48 family metallopeptidase [Vibrio agarilyticus]
MKLPKRLPLIAASLLIAACAQSPTGRNQITMLSGQQMTQLGAQSFEQMKKEIPISNDAATNRYVQCVTNAILKTIPPQPDFEEWEVVVFESDQVNAFALPGGKIGVFTGLLDVAENQHQLATVIGHEIAHVLANHSNERLSHNQIAGFSMVVADAALGASDYAEHSSRIMAGLGLGFQYGFILPYGRTHESEADTLGLRYMSDAGFDPRESVALWQNMAKASGGAQPPEFLTTHPSHSTRINALRGQVQQLPKYGLFPSAPECKKPR